MNNNSLAKVILNWTDKQMEEILNQSKAGLERLYNAKERLEFIISKLSDNAENAEELKLEEELNSFRQRFIEAMDDDGSICFHPYHAYRLRLCSQRGSDYDSPLGFRHSYRHRLPCSPLSCHRHSHCPLSNIPPCLQLLSAPQISHLAASEVAKQFIITHKFHLFGFYLKALGSCFF